MKSIELLYINFLDHSFLSGLEINFSQKFRFKLNSKGELSVTKVDSVNMFDEPILNLNVIIGNNGVGKTTIINEVYKTLHGDVTNNKVIVIKEDNTIYIYTKNQKVTFDYNESEKITEYKFKMINKGSYLKDKSNSNRKLECYKKELNLLYIPELMDEGVNLLPYENILSVDMLEKTIEDYKTDRLVKQIKFLAKSQLEILFKKPDKVKISIQYFLDNIKKEDFSKYGNTYFDTWELIKDIIESEKNPWKSLIDINFILSIISNLMEYCDSIVELVEESFENYEPEAYYNYDENFWGLSENIAGIDKSEDPENIIKEIKKRVRDYEAGILKIITNYSLQKLSITGFYNEHKKLYESTKMNDFHHNDEIVNIDNIFLRLKDSYEELNEMITLYTNDAILNLKIEDAGKFFEKYLVVKDQEEFEFVNKSLFKLEYIKYYRENEEFYFSSGQEQFLRIFTYIDLAISRVELEKDDSNSAILFLDGPDISFHPEMQKKFIATLNGFLKNYHNFKFHVILTTHSPIITSDLTGNHIIFLDSNGDERMPEIRSLTDEEKPKTFAQNIYNLYRETFFVKEGLIGNFSEEILSAILQQIGEQKNEENNKDEPKIEFPKTFNPKEIEFYINEIGEPLIRRKFLEIYKENKGVINKLRNSSDFNNDEKEKIIKFLRREGPDTNDWY